MNDEQLNITVGAKDEASDKLKEVSKNVRDIGGVGDDVREKLQKAGVAIGLIGAGLTAYSKNAVDDTVEYVKSVKILSAQTGMAVDTASKFQYALSRSGVGDATSQLGFFSKKIAEANDNAAEMAAKQADVRLKIAETENEIKLVTEKMQKQGDATNEGSLKLQRLNMDLQDYKDRLSEAATPLDELDVKTKNADGSARRFDEILLDVADKFKTMPDGAEKTAYAMELFGRGGKDLLPILSKGSDGIKDLADKADKLGLTLTPDNVNRVNDYINAQKDLKDKQQELTIAIGNEAIPMWKKLSEFQQLAIDKMLSLPAPLDKVFTGFLAFAGPAMSGAGAILSFGANLGTVAGSFPGIGGALKVLGGSFKALGGLLLGWPGIIIGVVAAVALMLQHMGLLKPMIDAVVEGAKWFWSTMVELLQPAFDSIRGSLEQLQPVFNVLLEVFKYAAIIIGGVIVAAIVTVIAIFTALVTAVSYAVAAVAAYFVYLKDNTVTLFKAIGDAVGGAWEFIRNAFNTGVGWIQGVWQRISEFPGKVAEWLGRVAGVVSDALNSAKQTVGDWIGTFFDSGKALIDAFTNGVKSAFGRVKDAVNEGLDAVRQLLPFSDAKEGPLSTLTLSGQRFSETFATGIEQGAPALERAARDALAGMNVNAVAPAIADAGYQGQALADPGLSRGASTAADQSKAVASVHNEFTGPIILQGADSVAAFFDRLDEDAQLVARGLAPVRGAM